MMSAVNVPPKRGRMEPSFDVGSATISDLCARLIKLQEDDDHPKETVYIQRILIKEWTICVNKALTRFLDKLRCRKCGIEPLELTLLLSFPHKIHPRLPEVLSEVRRLSLHPAKLLEGIRPEDHLLECFYEIECVWWIKHLNRDATFDSEGKVVTPETEAPQLPREAQLHVLAAPHPDIVLLRRRYLAKHGKLTYNGMVAEMERDSAIPKSDLKPSTTQRQQSQTTAGNQSSGILSRETTQAADPAVDRNLQIPPAPGPPSSSAYTPSRTQSSTGSLRQAPYPYPQPSGGQVNRPRIQATIHQTQGLIPTPVSSVVPNMQLPAAYTPSRTQSSTGSLRQAPSGGQVSRPRIQATAHQTQGPIPTPVSSVVPNMQLPAAYTPSRTQSLTGSLRQTQYPYPQPSGGQVNRPRIQATTHQAQGPIPTPVSSVVPNMQLPAARPRKIFYSNVPRPDLPKDVIIVPYRFGDNRGSLYAHTDWQKEEDARKLRKRTKATPQSSEPPQGLPALAPAPTPSPRRQSSWEDPLGNEATRSHIQNQANFQSPGMAGQHPNQFRQAEQAANMPYQPIMRAMPSANPQTSSFPSEPPFVSLPAFAQPQAFPPHQRTSERMEAIKIQQRTLEEAYRRNQEEDKKYMEAANEKPVSTNSHTKIVTTDNEVSQSTSQDNVAKTGHRPPRENSDDVDSLGGSEYDSGSIVELD